MSQREYLIITGETQGGTNWNSYWRAIQTMLKKRMRSIKACITLSKEVAQAAMG
jgi:hypothetical protein